MKYNRLLLLALLMWVCGAASAVVKNGESAPGFKLPDFEGKTRSLDEFKGKYVVLEWFNKDCPFVRKHYNSGNMQKLQKQYTGKGVVWLQVVSSAEGKQGFLTREQASEDIKKENSAATDLLLDTDGAIGKVYGAKTTPHIFVINPKGLLVYQGAIDDKPTPDVSDVPIAKNYVQMALDESMAGKAVSTPVTTAYGCSVKYK